MSGVARRPRVAIVGGGLAGLAAAAALVEQSWHVEVFEARRQFGGRAASFRDATTGEAVDYCQHVSLGCCTELADFCRRTGTDRAFDRYDTLYFLTPDGGRYTLGATRWLPAPLHLLPALLRLKYLSLRERWGVLRAMGQLLRLPRERWQMSIADWLRKMGQTPHAIETFWAVVLNSALGDSLDRCAVQYARQVFVEGFMTTRRGYEVLVPREPLSELFGRRAVEALATKGVVFHAETPIARVVVEAGRATGIETADGRRLPFDAVVVAVPWRRFRELFDQAAAPALEPAVRGAGQLTGAPITGVHLWFDRPITELPHAVLVGTLSQWLFQRSGAATANETPNAGEHYYQIVISASYALDTISKEELITRVLGELRQVFPAAREAQLVRSRVVTDPHAVFSPVPNVDELRPAQATPIANLALAGDWTASGWPATMEGAVRSGYLAAAALVAQSS
ncbi:MAG: FAD-dependent oxidoreductase [Planctomycetes bacterium]|nr:FAD-dependent oxidoreductase [Planctomycetota bacterium]